MRTRVACFLLRSRLLFFVAQRKELRVTERQRDRELRGQTEEEEPKRDNPVLDGRQPAVDRCEEECRRQRPSSDTAALRGSTGSDINGPPRWTQEG